MVIFYDKRTGDIFATIDGRVHDEKTMEAYATDTNRPKEFVGKFIIGWIESKDGGKIEYNLDQMDLVKDFEDITPTSPLDFKIDVEQGKLIPKLKEGK